ncbi:MAG: beta-ketoacyl synthase N-terminal-like domain-containing protein, partial [Exilibacterium sp.]
MIDDRPVEHGEIAIIGIACQFPQAANLPAFWQQMNQCFSCVTPMPTGRLSLLGIDEAELGISREAIFGGYLDNVELFDCELFRMSPREAKCVDPQHRLLLMNTHQAFFDADIFANPNFKHTGVFVSHYASEYMTSNRPYAKESALFISTGNATSISANRISYHYNFDGPSLVVDTACSSSLVAVDIACENLKKRNIDYAVVGAVNLNLNPFLTQLLQAANMLARDGKCKTFDKSADGYVQGEGVGVVVLQRLENALADGAKVYSVIAGSAVNQDGRSNGLTAPNGLAQELVIKESLRNANVRSDEVGYVETHGTGTYLGDPVEYEALARVFADKDKPRVLGCLKTNIGHLEPAAGLAGLIKAALCTWLGKIPGNNHLNIMNPLLKSHEQSFILPKQSMDWNEEKRIAGVSSFGFGGVNAHIILRNLPAGLSVESEKRLEDYRLYDFKQKSYWLDEISRSEKLHPQAGSPGEIPSGFLDFKLEDSPSELLRATLTVREQQLRGIEDTGNFHVGFYLESIYKLFSRQFNTNSIYIQSVEFLQALLISNRTETKLQFYIKQLEENHFLTEVYFKYQTPESEWSKAAQAYVTINVENNSALRPVPQPRIKPAEVLTEAQFYERYEKLGYPGQGYVRAIGNTKCYQNQSVSELLVSFDSDLYALGVHPGALDGILQPGLVMAVTTMHMATKMEGVIINGPLSNERHYRLNQKVLNTTDQQLTLFWQICDDQDRVIMQCERAMLKVVSQRYTEKSVANLMSAAGGLLTAPQLLEGIARLLDMKAGEVPTDLPLPELGMDSLMIMGVQKI